MGTILKIAAGIILAVVLLTVGCGLLLTAGSDEVAVELAEQQAAIEEDLVEQQAIIEEEIAAEAAAEEQEQRDRVSWEWVEDQDCDDLACWQILVTSEEGCPNGLYAELNVKNADDVVIDYTNASLGVLPAGQSAVLTFETYNEDAEAGEIAQVTCN